MKAAAPLFSLVDQAQAIRRGELTATAAVQAVLSAIVSRGGRTGAFCALCADTALAQASRADDLRASGATLGLLHGVPFALKDNILAEESPARAASAVSGAGMKGEAPLVTRLRRAGAILVGRTNMHEWAYGATNELSRYGRTCNPWDTAAITGGSSGGSAAAVADGLVPLAIGTDTGGSIRMPAAACGVSGFKPTPGAVSCEGVLPLAWSFDCAGPIARTAEDLFLAFRVLRQARGEGTDFDAARRLQYPVIGVLDSDALPLAPAVARLFNGALQAWREAGARLVPVRLEAVARAFAAWKTIMYAEASSYHRQYRPERERDYGAPTLALLQEGDAISAVDYLEAQRFRASFSGQWHLQLAEVDAIMMPTLPMTAPRSGQHHVQFGAARMTTQDAMTLIPFLANFAGLPAVALPCGFDEHELPASFSLVATPHRDDHVLGLAARFQDITDWHRRVPAVQNQESLHA